MKKIYETTILLGIVMFLSKLTAFVRDIVLTNRYGASYISDAFLVAVSIPTVLFSGIMTAVYTCYIPLYKELKKKKPGELSKFHGNIMTIVLLLSCLGIVLYWVLDDMVLKIFAFGFDAAAFQLAKELSRIMVLVMIFMGAACILQGYLQANESFLLVGAMTIPTNMMIALSIGISTEKTLPLMAWGTVIGYAVYLPYFAIPAYQKGFRLRLQIDLKEESIRRLFAMIIPVFLSQIVFEVNSIVDKSAASLLPAGGITALDYSFKLASMIDASIVAPLAMIVYPRFSGYMVESSHETLKRDFNKTLRAVEMIVIPIVGGVMVLARPIVEVIFFRGAFTSEAARLTAESLVVYAVAEIPVSLRVICDKVFYARKEAKIAMLNSMAGMAVNMILDILLVHRLAHVGLALATVVSSSLTFCLLFVSLRKRMGELGGKEIWRTGINSVLAAGIMSVCVHCCSQALSSAGNILQICLCAITGIVVYLAMLLLLREKMLFELFQRRNPK